VDKFPNASSSYELLRQYFAVSIFPRALSGVECNFSGLEVPWRIPNHRIPGKLDLSLSMGGVMNSK